MNYLASLRRRFKKLQTKKRYLLKIKNKPLKQFLLYNLTLILVPI
jgi:polyferredoxin